MFGAGPNHHTCSLMMAFDGFVLACDDLGRMFDNSFPTCAFFFFFKVAISLRTLIPLFRPWSVHSCSGCWDDWLNVPWQVACELVSRQVPTLCLESGIVSPLRLHWVKSACVFRCNLPPALLAEWPGSFTCHCSNMGVEQTRNKSQHTKLTLEKKIFPPLLPGFELATFRSRVRRSYQRAIQASSFSCIETFVGQISHLSNLCSLQPWKMWPALFTGSRGG